MNNSQKNSLVALAPKIDAWFEEIHTYSPQQAPEAVIEAVTAVMDGLNSGLLRVAEKINHQWIVHTWIKKAILLYFKLQDNQLIEATPTPFFDKIPLKYAGYSADRFRDTQTRVVPQAMVRHGAYVGKKTILMPSYINIGAYVDDGTMIDTWATVGSCAQVGKNVHISGGAGLGGVLEPLQANPTIIEDHCFIGARSEIVEGVIVGEGAVISMGVFIGASTKIYDRQTGKIHYGYVPPGSVVVPGSLPSKDGKCHLSCAVIVKQVDLQTRQKVGINALLRDE